MNRRYFLHDREISRRVALAEWLRLAASEGSLRARKLFELAEQGGARPGEVAQARGELRDRGIVITGVEGL
ncbi:hypothetical protein ACFOMD_18340 [Sphingoaurantiacus capsulatus]|uniref:Uncharacterized protein n=1 Tax=Sphingoaurantiacus capsulatus TaxID=1771310 RepID=A0ABV7XF33_9SPHN